MNYRYTYIFIFVCSSAFAYQDSSSRSSFPYITGATFRLFCNFILDCDTNNIKPAEIKDGDTIFLSRDFIETFFKHYSHRIKKRYILVTHHFHGNCDPSMPGPYAHYLEDENLIAWFTINTDIQHPKLKPLPLGIGNSFYDFGDTRVFNYFLQKRPAPPRTKLLYINFNVASAPEARTPVFNYFAQTKFCITPRKSHWEYLEDLLSHKFVASPPGNGIDCFRTWEALLMGSIPIVMSSNLDSLFEDLPVLIIKDWKEVTEEFLEQKYEEIIAKQPTYNRKKLYINYWFDEIRKCKWPA